MYNVSNNLRFVAGAIITIFFLFWHPQSISYGTRIFAGAISGQRVLLSIAGANENFCR